MSIANTEQAEHWNTGPGVAHWVANQARYVRMHAPFTALILDVAAMRPGGTVLDGGWGGGGRRGGRVGQGVCPGGRREGRAARAGHLRPRDIPLRGDVLRRPGRRLR